MMAVLKQYYKTILLISILLLSFGLNVYNNTFPLNFHGDEKVKVSNVISGNGNFTHPLLMIKVNHHINQVINLTQDTDIMVLGRIVGALFGVLGIYFIYRLAKNAFKNEEYAWLTALACAVSPILVIHAHYFKEDIYFTASTLFFLLALTNFSFKPSKLNMGLLTLALGLALSTQYKAIMLFFILFLPPLLNPMINKFEFYKKALLISIFSIIIFLIINYQIFTQFHTFLSGFSWSIHHNTVGHKGIKFRALENFFSFHLINSLVPGITLGVVILAIAGLSLVIYNWKKENFTIRLLLIFALVSYFSHEFSLLKPYPDFMRYMVTVSPILIFFAVLAFSRLNDYLKHYNKQQIIKFTTIFFLSIACIYPLYKSLNLDYYLIRDTRFESYHWLMHQTDKVAIFNENGRYSIDNYKKLLDNDKIHRSNIYFDYEIVDQNDVMRAKAEGIRYIIMSSFIYQRFLDAAKMDKQKSLIYERAKTIQWLFNHFHYLEIAPKYESFAFSNPTIRIIDLNDPVTVEIETSLT